VDDRYQHRGNRLWIKKKLIFVGILNKGYFSSILHLFHVSVDKPNLYAMKKLILAIMLFVFATSVYAQQANILVTPQWVKEHQNDPNLVILQVNFLKADYEREHIEGARFLWPAWLSPDTPEATFNTPDEKAANEILSNLGVSNNSQIVLCHTRSDVSVTARMFLLLEYLGMKGKVSFLNGGLEAWKAAGFPITNATPEFKKGKFKATINPVVVDKNYVSQKLTSDKSVIVDARMTRFYDGEPTGNPRDGHIAGAKNIPYPDLLDQATNAFKSSEQLQSYFEPVAPKTKEIVTYCFIGQTASVVYMAGRILGYDMKLYDGSMQEWSRIKELPMELTPKKENKE
jgi:thiosulfate/3-mercaptopyruvate sulfurtransferase